MTKEQYIYKTHRIVLFKKEKQDCTNYTISSYIDYTINAYHVYLLLFRMSVSMLDYTHTFIVEKVGEEQSLCLIIWGKLDISKLPSQDNTTNKTADVW